MKLQIGKYELVVEFRKADITQDIIRAVNLQCGELLGQSGVNAKIMRIKAIRNISAKIPADFMDKHDDGTVSLVAAKEFVERHW
jgi:hypothetical protein